MNKLFLVMIAFCMPTGASENLSKESAEKVSEENAQIFFNALRMTGIASQLGNATPEEQTAIERELLPYRDRIEKSAAHIKKIKESQ